MPNLIRTKGLLRSWQLPWGLHIQRSAGSSVRAGLGSYAVDQTLMPVK